MGVGLLAAHQPDLLPYSGFWHKLYHADVLDLAVFDQFQHPGYQNRVLMRGKWLTLPVERSEHGRPIVEVEIDGVLWAELLTNGVSGRYGAARNRREVLPWLAAAVRTAGQTCGDRLWLFNLSLLLAVRDRLGIRTPIALGSAPLGADSTDRLIEVCRQYRAQMYLSGQGGREYLDMVRFERSCQLRWSAHVPSTTDSVVTLLMDHDDPLGAVL
jgi:hypothetical protein